MKREERRPDHLLREHCGCPNLGGRGGAGEGRGTEQAFYKYCIQTLFIVIEFLVLGSILHRKPVRLTSPSSWPCSGEGKWHLLPPSWVQLTVMEQALWWDGLAFGSQPQLCDLGQVTNLSEP